MKYSSETREKKSSLNWLILRCLRAKNGCTKVVCSLYIASPFAAVTATNTTSLNANFITLVPVATANTATQVQSVFQSRFTYKYNEQSATVTTAAFYIEAVLIASTLNTGRLVPTENSSSQTSL